ncbi:MAG: TonB family protein, partial [Candidatus Latescibacterota bacterium]
MEYGKLLYAFLDANAHPGLPALGFNEKDTPLKKRFEHVLNFKGGTMKRSKWQYAIPVLVALAIVPFSIRETYSQAPSELPLEALNLRQEMVSKGSYGMMFKKRTSEVKLDLMEVMAPEYPQALSTQGIEGNIELELFVGIDGRVEKVMRVGGDERFEQVAIDALKKARFQPPQNGQSIKLFQKILFRFKDEKGLVIELPNTFWNTSDMGEMVVWAKSQKSAQQKRLKIKPIKQIPPVYPEDARLDGIEGFVIMDVTIDSDGQVRHVTMLDGNRRFEAAAKTALERFRYTPFTHTQSIKKAEAMVFKLSGDNWPEYNLPEGLITPSKFESYLTIVAKAPKREKIGDGILEQQEQNEKSVESEQKIIDGG